MHHWVFPGGSASLVAQRIHLQYRRCRRCWFNPWFGKIPWRRTWQPTLVFLPGKSHEQRRLVGYSLQGHRESNMTEVTECMDSKSPSRSLDMYSTSRQTKLFCLLYWNEDFLLCISIPEMVMGHQKVGKAIWLCVPQTDPSKGVWTRHRGSPEDLTALRKVTLCAWFPGKKHPLLQPENVISFVLVHTISIFPPSHSIYFLLL